MGGIIHTYMFAECLQISEIAAKMHATKAILKCAEHIIVIKFSHSELSRHNVVLVFGDTSMIRQKKVGTYCQ